MSTLHETMNGFEKVLSLFQFKKKEKQHVISSEHKIIILFREQTRQVCSNQHCQLKCKVKSIASKSRFHMQENLAFKWTKNPGELAAIFIFDNFIVTITEYTRRLRTCYHFCNNKIYSVIMFANL